MEKFIELYPNIYRLSVPFESVLTSVFAVVVDGNCIIIDSATTESDVKNYILPAISEAGFNVTKILASLSAFTCSEILKDFPKASLDICT